MPCSGEPYPGYYEREMQEVADKAARAACDLAHQIRKHFPKAWIRMCECPEGTKGKALLSAETLRWIEEHDKADSLRRQRERKERRRERKRREVIKTAKAKLTPEEFKMLVHDVRR
jgi:hypothetical protein